jgi:DNA replication protein DnaC
MPSGPLASLTPPPSSTTSSRATKRRWNASQLLEHIADAEQRERTKCSLDRRVDRSRLGGFKPLADFDWAWPTRIDRDAVDAAMRLDFLAGHRNIVLVGPRGSARR